MAQAVMARDLMAAVYFCDGKDAIDRKGNTVRP
jgi:hypothetical protein